MGRFSKLLMITLAFVLVFFVTQPSGAQVVTGSISGTVLDPSAAGVPQAKVTVTNRGTGEKATATTSDSGSFRLSLLPTGTYDLEITKQGFKKLKLTSVAVDANVDHALSDLKLELGEMTSTVEVSAAAPIIESTQAQITTAVTGTQLNAFPGIAENQGLDFLALQVPGVVNSRDVSFSNSNGVDFAVNGLRSRNNDQQIDGQNNNDNSVAGPGLFLSNIDFVQEYQITTNNFGPEYGRNSGSVVNIVTKTGTNRWHGAVSGTESNSVLTSLTNTQKFFEGLKKPPRFNDEFTSGTIGGPIWKDHVFLFGGFDDQIISSRTNYAAGTLTPTPLGLNQLAACYPNSDSVKALASFGPFGVSGGNPIINGTPKTVTLTTSGGGTCSVEFSGVQRNLSDSTHEYDWVYRTDVVVSQNDRFSGRYIFQKIHPFNADPFLTAAAGYPSDVPSLSQDFLLDWTHTVSSNMVNEFRVSFSRLNVEFGSNGIGNTIPNQGQIGDALARVTVSSSGGNNFLGYGPATNAPQGRIVNTWQVQDNWSYTHGRHTWKSGVNFTYQRSPNIFLPNLNGSFNFASILNTSTTSSRTLSNSTCTITLPPAPSPTSPTSINSFSAYACNFPSTINVALGTPSLDFREYDTFLYAGDDWKVKDNLTLNLGLTWSYYGQPANLFHNITTKRESNPATAFWLTSLPLSDRTFPELPTVKNAFGPSAGFAWTPNGGGWLTGNGKTVLRGGYRLTYDPPFYNIYINISSSAPQVFLQTLTGSTARSNPLPKAPFGPKVRSELATSLTPGVFDPRNFNRTTVTPNFGPDRVHSWTFGLQRQIVKNAAFEARYVGNHGFDLFQTINQNPLIDGLAANFPKLVPSGLTPCTTPIVPNAAGREFCDHGVTRERTNTAYSDYNAIQTELRTTNIFNQLSLRTGYTFSKTTDNVTEIFSSFGGGNTYFASQNPLDFKKGEHGLSGLDIPNSWTISFVEDIPFFRAQHGVVGHILGGWGISGSYILQSGQTYTPVQAVFNFFTGGVANDSAFNRAFISSGVFDTSRPFVGSASAPVTSLGIFAGDACSFYAITGLEPVCALDPATLIDLTSINQAANIATFVPKTVSKNQVRLIVNGGEADTLFNTPFGNAARNSLRDAITNVGNFSVFKNIKFGERATLQWHITMLNVFNHPNFFSVDPFLEDAGDNREGDGFGTPSLFSGGLFNGTGPGRSIRFGLKVIF